MFSQFAMLPQLACDQVMINGLGELGLMDPRFEHSLRKKWQRKKFSHKAPEFKKVKSSRRSRRSMAAPMMAPAFAAPAYAPAPAPMRRRKSRKSRKSSKKSRRSRRSRRSSRQPAYLPPTMTGGPYSAFPTF